MTGMKKVKRNMGSGMCNECPPPLGQAGSTE